MQRNKKDRYSLERPRVVTLIGQRKATGVSQHVWGRFEPKLGADTRPLRSFGQTQRS